MNVEANRLALSHIGQIGIMVRDVEAATVFYRDKLGMKHLFTAAGMAFFDLGEVRLMLGQVGKPEDWHPASILYYRVDDIDRAFETLRERGVQVVEKPEMAYRAGNVELWLAFFHDLDNNVVALMCEKSVGH